MHVEERIRDGLKDVDIPVYPEPYEGTELEYITFNYSEYGRVWAEGRPDCIEYDLQVHWWFPRGKSPYPRKKKIREALYAAGMTWPSITNASDDEGQHLVFEGVMIGDLDDG